MMKRWSVKAYSDCHRNSRMNPEIRSGKSLSPKTRSSGKFGATEGSAIYRLKIMNAERKNDSTTVCRQGLGYEPEK